MKTLKVYDDTHREVKIEAAKAQRTVPNMTTDLLNLALSLVRSGKAKLPEKATK